LLTPTRQADHDKALADADARHREEIAPPDTAWNDLVCSIAALSGSEAPLRVRVRPFVDSQSGHVRHFDTIAQIDSGSHPGSLPFQ
jgi:hypothetical protein